jgi:amino acid transporter
MAKTGNRGKALKISMVLNVVIMQIFLTLNFLTNFRNRNIELTITYYAVFAVFIVLANFLIYRHFKKEPTTLKW